MFAIHAAFFKARFAGSGSWRRTELEHLSKLRFFKQWTQMFCESAKIN
jgi:hypothetical protein